MTEKSVAKATPDVVCNFSVDDDNLSVRLSQEANSLPSSRPEDGTKSAQSASRGKDFSTPISTEMPPVIMKPTDGDKSRSAGDKSLVDDGNNKGAKKIDSKKGDEKLLLPDIYLEIDKAIDNATKNSRATAVPIKTVIDAGTAKGTENPERAGTAKRADAAPGAQATDGQKPDSPAGTDRAKPKISEADGTVLVNGVSSDSKAAERHVKTVVTKDGTFVRDEKNRVISSESPDGKVKREFKYGDAKDPNKITTVKENGLTYEYLGPNKYVSSGEIVKTEGFEMASWTIYDSNRQIKGNWSGSKTISPEGVYIEVDNKTSKIKFEDGSGKELTKEQAARRNKDGIWPSTINIARPDGSTIEAKLQGTVVDSLKEKRTVDGKEKTVTWSKDGDAWTSDETPAGKRTDLTLNTNGDLSYTERNGTKKVESKNSELFVTNNGVKDSYDRYGERVQIDTEDGVRNLKYNKDAKGVATVSEITTKTGDAQSVWTRKGNTDEWTSADKSEIRKDLKVLADGSLQFTDKDGKRVKETIGMERINYNAKDLPELVTFPSGAKRTFTYDAQGLSKFVDHIPTKDGGKHDLVWERDKDDSFISKRENDKVYRRDKVSVTDDADIRYVSAEDKKPHEARVRDIDRIARGEFVLSSESVVEARDRLVDAVKNSGLNQDRFNQWIKEFEENAAKNKISPEKIVKTMNNLSDILTTKEKSPHFDREQLKSIVETGMHNITKYLEIDQGSHPTCNVASVEVVAARKHPDQYTRLLKEVALTGSWTTSEGKKSTPPTGYKGTDPDGKAQVYHSLKPGKDEVKYDVGIPDTGDRNIASQVVQMTLINAMYEHGHMNDVKDGKVTTDRTNTRYVMGPNRVRTENTPGGQVIIDVGEDLLMKDGRPVLDNDGKPAKGGPGFVQDNVIQSAVLLFGEKPAFIGSTGWFDNPQTGRREYKNDLPTKQKMLAWKNDGQMPIFTPTMGGAHSQTIHDAWEDPVSGKLWVLLDNQHGEPEVKGSKRNSGEGDGDGWITLEQLHDTLKASDQGSGFGKPIMPTIHKYSHPSKVGK